MYWSEHLLKNIVGYLGTILKIDIATITKSKLQYARVLVDMNIFEGFPEELYYSNEDDELVSQSVQYEWIPVWCSKCKQFGHNPRDCRMGHPKVPKSHLEVDDNGFRMVKKGFKGGVGKTNNIHNATASLAEGMSTLEMDRQSKESHPHILEVHTSNGFSALSQEHIVEHEVLDQHQVVLNGDLGTHEALGANPIPDQ